MQLIEDPRPEESGLQGSSIEKVKHVPPCSPHHLDQRLVKGLIQRDVVNSLHHHSSSLVFYLYYTEEV